MTTTSEAALPLITSLLEKAYSGLEEARNNGGLPGIFPIDEAVQKGLEGMQWLFRSTVVNQLLIDRLTQGFAKVGELMPLVASPEVSRQCQVMVQNAMYLRNNPLLLQSCLGISRNEPDIHITINLIDN